jgi:two-component system phosphate regulon sensor histidine kinase PhoR
LCCVSRSHDFDDAQLSLMTSIGALLGPALDRALETMRIDAAVRAERLRLDAILEALPIVVAVIGREGEVRHLNAAGRAFAHEFQNMGTGDWRVGMTNVITTWPDGRPVAPDDFLVARAFRGEHPPPRELQISSLDGRHRKTVLSVAAPLTDARGEVESVVTGFQDVSALRELANAKDRFLRVASHELRSPLTALRATTSLLDMDPAAITDPERRRVLIERVQRQVDRLTRLVEQLLDSVRLNATEPPLTPEPCDLEVLCKDAIAAVPLASGHQLHLDAEGPVVGLFDPLRVEQVLTNLLSNAVRYSPPGSTITVRLRTTARTATVEISDQGIGIPPDQLDRVFTPFFRGSNASTMHKGGLGLGLHITHEIVRRHGGAIRVRSTVGAGTTFTVELPRELTVETRR